MKQLSGCVFAICLIFLLHLRVFALNYRDDFTDGSTGGVKGYYGLAPMPLESPSWSALPDRSAFTFASSSFPYGYALYRAQNASRITVGFYTMGGSFASYTGSIDAWVLGLSSEQSGAEGALQTYYSPSTDLVYARINGDWYIAETGEFATVFKTASAQPPGDTVFYAVNVRVSRDGQRWEYIPLTRTSLVTRPNLPVYEEISGSVPAGVRYLRVELNDVVRFPVYGNPGVYLPKVEMGLNSLASVTITGENLILGEPEPVVREPVVSESVELDELEDETESEAAKKSSSSQKQSNTSPQSSGKASGGSESSAVLRYEASKFEGVIEASSSSSKKSSVSSEKSSRTQPSQAPESPPPQSEPEPPPYADDTIYRIGSKDSDDKHFTAGVTVYIIVVTGALAFIVAASAVRKK